MPTLNDLDERITDLEQYIYDSDAALTILVQNQSVIVEKLNEIILYTGRLFISHIDTLTLHEVGEVD